MASPTDNNEGFFSDVRKVGYLRKPKSMHKRFFVLRAASESGPARLEYYENEKKWRHKSGAPKRSIPLESCFNINKRADSKNKHLVALYTKDEHFAIAADSEPEQESWYQALLAGLGEAGDDSYVILKPKGLGQTKNLIGIYRLCLTNKTISFVKLNSDAAAVVLQLLNIRRCGHSENFFFIEVGRSAVTGPGEFWMQVDDSVVAQNMHETILEAPHPPSPTRRHPHSLQWPPLRSTQKCCLPTLVVATGCSPTGTLPLCPLTPTLRSIWRCTTWTAATTGPTPPHTRMMATCQCHLGWPLCPALVALPKVVTICP
uniref:Insulin receptor substrate 1 n=1 Tax=Gopherus evgoodei TaxID=1825980 RepID=A0A8C4WGW7_9SAUR